MSNDSMIIALSLDKSRGKEHVVIGAEAQVYSRLRGNKTADVLYDEVRPLGEFLFSHERQLDKEWNIEAIYPLKRALDFPMRRKEYEDAAWRFIDHKESSVDPVDIFTAYCCRRWYTEQRTLLGNGKNANQFESRIMGLTRSFKQIIWGKEKKYTIDQALEHVEQYTGINADARDMQARIWYPGKRQKAEYLIVENSYFPAIWYYLHHLRDWGFCICKCDSCGRMFLSTSMHFSLCSAACRKAKNLQNKRDFDDRAKRNKYDVDYKNATQRMRNRLNSLCKNEGIPENQRTQIQAAFKTVCQKAIQQKKQIKTPGDYRAFVDWLFGQEYEFDRLCEEVMSNAKDEIV